MSLKSVIVERDVEIRMRDGVALRADVYRPQGAGPLPVLLQRTPYGKAYAQTSLALLAAERGYAVVIQDTRGRWASEGDGKPFVYEKADGYDTVEWAAHQPWADGQVGMFGGSYVGYTQYAAAAARPPSLKTIVPTVSFCDPYDILYSGGAFQLGIAVSWMLGTHAAMAILRGGGDERQKHLLTEQLADLTDGMARGATFRHLPLESMPMIGRAGLVSYLAEALDHPEHDAYWQSVACPYEAVTVPVLHFAGWYDCFIGSLARDWPGIAAAGNTRQRALIGPWYHGSMEGVSGEVDFGMRASSAMVLPDELHLRWFDYWLKGVENGVMDEPPLQIFVMGANRWRAESEWPLRRTQYTPYYLHSGGAANTLNGDGVLSPELPAEEAVDTFVYDPHNPVPTRGGGLCCSPAALAAGAFDQRGVEARPDVLVYTTAPLSEDVEVTGPVEVRLWAATSAVATDFTAKLVDVGPCGYARNVQDGIVRGRAAGVGAQEARAYVISLAATSNVFRAGHRIRVEISSSNFPRFDRNPNTGAAPGSAAELRPAVQTVLHDAAHPSHIVLPIIPTDGRTGEPYDR